VILLLVLLCLLVVAGVAAVAAGLITGGLDDPATTVPVCRLPDGPPSEQDVRGLRFSPALRGYRMDQVDAALDRLGQEIARLRAELAARTAEEPSAQEPSAGEPPAGTAEGPPVGTAEGPPAGTAEGPPAGTAEGPLVGTAEGPPAGEPRGARVPGGDAENPPSAQPGADG
jgi:DivIVA domain-containing protein